MRSLGWTVLLASLLVVIPLGCDKSSSSDDTTEREDDDSSRKKKRKKTKKKSDSVKRGASTKYHPVDCSKVRVFVDMRPALAIDDVKESFKGALDKLAAMDSGAPKFMEHLYKGGVEPAKTLKEFSLCFFDRSGVAALAFAPGKIKDPLTLLNDAAVASGEKKATPAPKRGDIEVLNLNSTERLAFVKPNVLVFTDADEDLKAVEAGKGAKGFADFLKHVAYIWVKERRVTFEATVDKKGSKFNVSLTLSGKKIEGDAERQADKIKDELDRLAEHLEDTPLKMMGKRLATAKCKAKGDKVIITGSFTEAHVETLVKDVAAADPADLKKAF